MYKSMKEKESQYRKSYLLQTLLMNELGNDSHANIRKKLTFCLRHSREKAGILAGL